MTRRLEIRGADMRAIYPRLLLLVFGLIASILCWSRDDLRRARLLVQSRRRQVLATPGMRRNMR